jgi:hypothetical protein
MDINSIRYVHQPVGFGHSNQRFTAAYIRTPSKVYFAWTVLYHTDEYIKSVGREEARKRLVIAIDSFDELGDQEGIIDIESMRHMLSDTLADHVLDELTFMDLKHGFIGGIIRTAIAEYIDAANY